MAGLDEELDRLYGLALAEFTPARNELAARLKREGRADEATGVKALAKPTVTAWAVNQLARRERRRVRELLALAERQREALGRGDTAAMREAAGEERRVLRELVAAARTVLGEEGRPSQATLEKISATLRAAAGDPEARTLLEQGRLTRELETSGFGALAGVKPVRRRPPEVDKRKRQKELREQLRALQKRARELEREADRAEAAAASARAAAGAAQEDISRVERELFETN